MENELGQILMQERMAMFDAFNLIAQVAFTLEIIALLALLLMALFLSKIEEGQADLSLAHGLRRGRLVLARIALAIAAALVIIPLIV
ncbi:MAG: hypothetical protein AB7U82_16290 [Blastocatellales bacterium]